LIIDDETVTGGAGVVDGSWIIVDDPWLILMGSFLRD
jgi:hypothetical protein